MSKHTALITYDYDENQESIFETFGTTAARMAQVTSNILTHKEYKTITQGLITELQKGNITGGELLGLAASHISQMQHRVGAMRGLFSRMMGEGEMEHDCANCEVEDCPDRKDN